MDVQTSGGLTDHKRVEGRASAAEERDCWRGCLHSLDLRRRRATGHTWDSGENQRLGCDHTVIQGCAPGGAVSEWRGRLKGTDGRAGHGRGRMFLR